MKALILAYRDGSGLQPLTESLPPALLPVAGRPLIEHTLNELKSVGIHEAVVVLSAHAEKIEAFLKKDGNPWGMKLDFRLVKGSERPHEVVQRFGARMGSPFVAISGDTLRSSFLNDFLKKADGIKEVGNPHAILDAQSARVWLVRKPDGDPIQLHMSDGRFSPIESLEDYHAANMEAVGGLYKGLSIPGKRQSDRLVMGEKTKVKPGSIESGPVFVGSHCRIDPSAEISGPAILYDNVILDKDVRVKWSVVLPDTYLGKGIELKKAIAWKNKLIRVDLGTVIPIIDSFLMADNQKPGLKAIIDDFANRVLALSLFIVSIPLWLVALGLALGVSPRAPMKKVRLLGNKRFMLDDGQWAAKEFGSFEFSLPVPLLRHLPKLFSVMAGHLKLVGVSPMSPDAAQSRREEWEFVRDEAPSGLIGPTQLMVPPDAPDEDRKLMDATYAQSRSLKQDLIWMTKGLLALINGQAFGL